MVSKVSTLLSASALEVFIKNLINFFRPFRRHPSVSVPAHQGALGVSLPHDILNSYQIFSVEFVLSFLIVFTVFATMDPSR